MLKYHKGDLFSTSDPIIAHGCNSMGVMGSGVAKIIRSKYPGAYDIYSKSLRALGTNIIYHHFDKIIVNMITQERYGRDITERYVSYDAIDSCFKHLIEWMIKFNYKTVSIPKIGAGLGNGNWNIISEIIEFHSGNITINVWEL